MPSGIEAKLSDLIQEALVMTGGRPAPNPFQSSDMLLMVLDSIVLTTLLALVEDEWDIEFSDEEIDETLLITLGTLAAAVEQKRPTG
jgi:acyl carrier protein